MNELLFNKVDLHAVLQAQEKEALRFIDDMERHKLAGTPVDALAAEMHARFLVRTPRVREAEAYISQREVEIDVSRDPHRWISDRSRPFLIGGNRISFHLPFDGDKEIFRCRPSQFDLNPPRAEITGHELVFEVEGIELAADRISSEIEAFKAKLQVYLRNSQGNVDVFNERLKDSLKHKIEQRLGKIIGTQSVMAGLGYPVKTSADTTVTYAAPEVRRQGPSAGAGQTEGSAVLEPALPPQEYEHILSVFEGMSSTMERSPASFSALQEEPLRDLFLAQLNGHYKGQATAETFNHQGKTDILVRSGDKNIFIGECKFWKGQQALSAAIDQLLGYISWRDTKAALIIFNKNRSLSAVLSQIPGVFKAHGQYKQEVVQDGETRFRYVMRQPSDADREILVTVLVFEIPE